MTPLLFRDRGGRPRRGPDRDAAPRLRRRRLRGARPSARAGSPSREADLARRAAPRRSSPSDFDLDEDAAALVVSLVDQIHGLRRALRRLGEAVEAEAPEVRARVRGRLALPRG